MRFWLSRGPNRQHLSNISYFKVNSTSNQNQFHKINSIKINFYYRKPKQTCTNKNNRSNKENFTYQLKFQSRLKSYKCYLQVRINSIIEAKSILLKYNQTYQNQFYTDTHKPKHTCTKQLTRATKKKTIFNCKFQLK